VSIRDGNVTDARSSTSRPSYVQRRTRIYDVIGRRPHSFSRKAVWIKRIPARLKAVIRTEADDKTASIHASAAEAAETCWRCGPPCASVARSSAVSRVVCGSRLAAFIRNMTYDFAKSRGNLWTVEKVNEGHRNYTEGTKSGQQNK